MKKILLAGLCVIVGCEQRPPTEQAPVTVAAQSIEAPRFRVTTLAEFRDNTAYRDVRRIYEIHDTKTGRTYLGVTGLGLDRLRADEDAQDAADAFNAALGDTE